MPTYPLKRMTKHDASDAVSLAHRLKQHTTAQDWKRLISQSNQGAFCIYEGFSDRLVTTGLHTIYERQRAWLGMLLTDPDFQRRGHGTRMLETLLQNLERKGIPAIWADATPIAEPMLTRQGFEAVTMVHRWVGRLPARLDEAETTTIRPAIASDRESLIALDADYFGVARPHLLTMLLEHHNYGVWVEAEGEALRGFIAIEDRGGNRVTVGPWMHPTAGGLSALFHVAMGAFPSSQLLADVPATQADATALLRGYGLDISTDFIRLQRGDPNPTLSPQYAASAGPAWG